MHRQILFQRPSEWWKDVGVVRPQQRRSRGGRGGSMPAKTTAVVAHPAAALVRDVTLKTRDDRQVSRQAAAHKSHLDPKHPPHNDQPHTWGLSL